LGVRIGLRCFKVSHRLQPTVYRERTRAETSRTDKHARQFSLKNVSGSFSANRHGGFIERIDNDDVRLSDVPTLV